MLTGKRAFEGENPASVIAAVLEREPAIEDGAHRLHIDMFNPPNFVAGKKTFVAFEQFHGRPSIAFRLDHENVERLSGNPPFFAMPYGRGQWLSSGSIRRSIGTSSMSL